MDGGACVAQDPVVLRYPVIDPTFILKFKSSISCFIIYDGLTRHRQETSAFVTSVSNSVFSVGHSDDKIHHHNHISCVFISSHHCFFTLCHRVNTIVTPELKQNKSIILQINTISTTDGKITKDLK